MGHGVPLDAAVSQEKNTFLTNCIFKCNLKNTIICPRKSALDPPHYPLAECDISLDTDQISTRRLTETDGEATHQTSWCCLSAPANGAKKVSPRAGESFLQLGDRREMGVRRPLCCISVAEVSDSGVLAGLSAAGRRLFS